jgi:ADP-ribose pyrophosphatase
MEILDSRELARHNYLSFQLKTLRLPDGSVHEKAVITHPGAVAIVPLLPDGRVVLIRQYRLAAEATLYEIPAGTLEPEEDPAACAVRELQEEAGYYPQKLTPLVNFYVAPGSYQEYMHLFLAEDLRPSELEKDADEVIEVTPMTVDNALSLLHTGEIRDAKTIIGLLYVARVV